LFHKPRLQLLVLPNFVDFVHSAISAATRTKEFTLPLVFGGEQTTILGTPATLAGINGHDSVLG